MSFTAHWNFPTAIWFGANTIDQLTDALKTTNISKPLIVTDPFLATLPIIDNILGQLQKNHITPVLFSNIKSNPTRENVEQGADLARTHHINGIVALGGGSAIDCGKSIALICCQQCELFDLEDIGDQYQRADESKILPCIAIPTTAGTGSEVGRAAVITDEDSQTKKIIFHPKMIPNLVIADPNLTRTLPKALTAATGMDALAHNLEAFCAPGFHPMADGIALEGMRLINEWLILAYEQPENMEARSHMLAAAIMGASAFQKGLGAIHSLSHPVGARYDAHHGLLNAIFMPYVLKLNRPEIDNKMQRLATHLNLENKTSGFDSVYQWILTLLEKLDLPHHLKAINIDATEADLIAQLALADGSSATNPKPLTQALLKSVFVDAVNGHL
jgi:alcohol dehydrogenase class IV